MFSQRFSRSTAIRRNSFGYRPFRLFATCSSFPCKVCHFRLSQNRGSVRDWGSGASCVYSKRSNQLSYAPRLDPAHEVDEARVSCAADCNENLEKESRAQQDSNPHLVMNILAGYVLPDNRTVAQADPFRPQVDALAENCRDAICVCKLNGLQDGGGAKKKAEPIASPA